MSERLLLCVRHTTQTDLLFRGFILGIGEPHLLDHVIWNADIPTFDANGLRVYPCVCVCVCVCVSGSPLLLKATCCTHFHTHAYVRTHALSHAHTHRLMNIAPDERATQRIAFLGTCEGGGICRYDHFKSEIRGDVNWPVRIRNAYQ